MHVWCTRFQTLHVEDKQSEALVRVTQCDKILFITYPFIIIIIVFVIVIVIVVIIINDSVLFLQTAVIVSSCLQHYVSNFKRRRI